MDSPFDNTVAQSEPPPATTRALPAGTRVGRYVIGRTLGAGGMGVVYVARDPALARDVAIKLLRSDLQSESLQREAQALAKLDHPNVVTVYDVGEHEGQAFVAMALVEGKNLRQWRAEKRTVREVLRVIVDMGRGVAAAHAAGLVHRDLKPDNVFVSDRGQVLVGDFGLARATGEVDRTIRERAATEPVRITSAHTQTTVDEQRPLSRQMLAIRTMTGAAGTPAYMAPEQARGRPSVASDQFSLCMTAWETLYGTRPFAGDTIDGIRAAHERGAIVEPPAVPGVPKRVRRALERGLSPDPAKRWPSVGALLAELSGERARRRRILAIGAAAVVLAVGATFGIARMTQSSGPRCRTADERLAEAWTPVRAAEIRTKIAAVAPFAQTSVDHAIETLDNYAVRWRSSWDSACGVEVSDAARDLRVACLDDRLHALDSAAETIRDSDRAAALHVLDVVAYLPAIEHCDDLASLGKVATPPAAIAGPAAEVERAIGKGEALSRAGRYREAAAILERAHREANALGFAPTDARAQVSLGQHLMREDRVVDAKPLFEGALNRAIAANDDETTARAYVALLAAAVVRGDATRAKELWATADAAVLRIGDPPALRARLVVHGASLPMMSGDYNGALAKIEQAIPALERAHRFRDAASLYSVHDALLAGLGRFDEARVAYDHEVAAEREQSGSNHPDYGGALLARCGFRTEQQEYEAAGTDCDTGYQILSRTLPGDDPRVLKGLSELASLDLVFGRKADALDKLRRIASAMDPAGPQAAYDAHAQLADALVGYHETAEAERELARAAELAHRLGGAYPIANEFGYARLRFEQGRVDEAEKLLDHAEPEMTRLLGSNELVMVDIWLMRASVAVARKQPAKAVSWLRRIRSGPSLLEARVMLAETLAQLGDKAGEEEAKHETETLLAKIAAGARPEIRSRLAKLE